ncbi:hypothetical protein P0136_08130 [Lentisphaerota bacterium ZTH]|nr:hypothetical protein JYG24_00760 [Lentisphaerota bacterium]WET05331.1 hypothetical protein P0136_08130 [Lentisphaerota bacterium ZTH]
MKKSFSIVFLFTFTMIFCLSLKAEVKCAQCGKMVSETVCQRMDTTEIEFRKLYLDIINNFTFKEHSELLDKYSGTLNQDMLNEIYHIPAREGLFKESETEMMAKAVEAEFQEKRLVKSVGDCLPYEVVRKDIKESSSGLSLPSESEVFEFNDDGYDDIIDTQQVCEHCRMGTLQYDDPDNAKCILPRNIQLALRLDRIVNDSDITIIFYDNAISSLNNLLLSYYNLFSNKRFVLGIDSFDNSQDWSEEKLNEKILKIVHQEINKQCDNSFPLDLSALITGMGFPVFNFQRYSACRQPLNSDQDYLYDAAFSFFDARCKNAVCFGVESVVTNLGWVPDYKKAVEDNFAFLTEVCKDLTIKPPVNEKEWVQQIDYWKMLAYNVLGTSKICRNEIARKISAYYAAVNKNRPDGNIPFVIVLKDEYGLVRDDNGCILEEPAPDKKELLIQQLIKGHLNKFNLKDTRVTTIYAARSEGTYYVFSKDSNDLLTKFGFDYLMLYQEY